MLDDIDEDNAPLMVVPQSHLGKTLNHHYRGVFSGAVDLKEEKVDYSTSYKITGKAGSTSFHHVKALHGSGPNQSDRPRRMLFFEYAAADAWPLVDFEAYGDFAEYEEKMVLGKAHYSHVLIIRILSFLIPGHLMLIPSIVCRNSAEPRPFCF